MPIRTFAPFAAAAALLLAAVTSAPSTGTTVPDPRIGVSETTVAAQLPEQLVFADHMGTAQIAPLAASLELAGTPADTYQAGDVAYWEGDRSVIVFLTDGAAIPAEGLIVIGRVTHGLGDLTGCTRDCVVRIDRAAR